MAAPSPELSILLRQLESTTELSTADRKAICGLPFRVRDVIERRDIVRDFSRPHESCLVLEGMLCRYKMLSNGRRQILSFHFAGDMPDLQSIHLMQMDHAIASITPARIALVPHEAVQQLGLSSPTARNALYRQAVIDASVAREWIASIGRRTALERVAHLICECVVRMSAVGLTHQSTFELPLTQAELGDATGLSNVHINRTMKELRRLRLIQSVGKIHVILNWETLQEVGDFDPGYLHLRQPSAGIQAPA